MTQQINNKLNNSVLYGMSFLLGCIRLIKHGLEVSLNDGIVGKASQKIKE